jgi:uncharacterized protein (UPF0333 family)
MKKMKNLLIVPAAVLTLSVGSLTAQSTISSASVKNDVAVKQAVNKNVADTAKSLAGTRYLKGGDTPKGFDASGFTQYVLKHSSANITIPRKINDQWSKGKHVKQSELKPGDLVFFKEYGNTPNLVGIYIGKNQFAATTVKGTKIYSLSQTYWKHAFAGGVRYDHSVPSAAVTKWVEHHYKNSKFLRYPQVTGLASKTAEQKINAAFLKHIQGSYKAYLEMLKEEQKDHTKHFPYQYDVSYKVQYASSNQLSLLFYDYEYTGGAHGMTAVTSLNFDAKTGKQYNLTDMVNTKSKVLKVQKYAYQVLHKQYPDFVQKVSDVAINKNTQFYYTKGGIYLLFQEYDVAPYAAGNPVVKIPQSLYK